MAVKFVIAILLVACSLIQFNHARPNADPKWWDELASKVSGLADDAKRGIQKGYNSVANAAEEFADDTGKFFKDVGNKVEEGYHKAADAVEEAVDDTGKFFKKVGNKVEEGYQKAADAVEEAVDDTGKFFKKVGNKVEKGYQKAADAVEEAVDDTGKFFKKVGKKVEEGYQKTADAIEDAIDDTGKFFKKVGKKVGTEVEGAVNAAAKELRNSYGIVVKTVDEAVEDASRFFNKAGSVVSRGYNQVTKYIDEAAESVKDAATSLATTVNDVVKDVVNVAKEAMKQEDLENKIIYLINATESKVRQIQTILDEAADSTIEGSDNPALKVINKFNSKLGSVLSSVTGIKKDTAQCALNQVSTLYKTIIRDGAQCVTDIVINGAGVLRDIVGLIPKARAVLKNLKDVLINWKENLSVLIPKLQTIFFEAVRVAKDGAIYFAQAANLILSFKATMGICATGIAINVGVQLIQVSAGAFKCAIDNEA